MLPITLKQTDKEQFWFSSSSRNPEREDTGGVDGFCYKSVTFMHIHLYVSEVQGSLHGQEIPQSL